MNARAPANDSHIERHWGMLLVFLAIMFAAGLLGGAVTFPEIGGWYASIAKPAWTPPNGVFTPVWNTIFALTGIATWLTWRRAGSRRDWVVPFAAQWGLNVAWSIAFFGFRSPGAALVVIVLLLAAILVLARAYWKVRPLAGALLAPYIAWVAYATALNLAIWRLN